MVCGSQTNGNPDFSGRRHEGISTESLTSKDGYTLPGEPEEKGSLRLLDMVVKACSEAKKWSLP